jgi:hypothetical protein
MIKIYNVISDKASVELAQVRTDGHAVEFTVDNTNGKLPAEVKTFADLQDYIQGTSHLKLVQPTEPLAHLLRYTLENGDLVEVTTDGATCLVNGRLISQEEKASLFDAISEGKIAVAHKADINSPIPVLPQKPKTVNKPALNRHLMKMYSDESKQLLEDRKQKARQGESDLTGMEFDDPDSAHMVQNMLTSLARAEDDNA